MPRRRQYNQYDYILGGDDNLKQGYKFGIKIRRNILDEELTNRLELMKEVLHWKCWYGHARGAVRTNMSLKDANRLMCEIKQACCHETIVIDWSALVSFGEMHSRRINTEKTWTHNNRCPCCEDVLDFILV